MDIDDIKSMLKGKSQKESALWELVSLLQMENRKLASNLESNAKTISRLEEIENHHRKQNGMLREELNLNGLREKGL
jgi:uncharacterized protein YqfB (UPF0267 family)